MDPILPVIRILQRITPDSAANLKVWDQPAGISDTELQVILQAEANLLANEWVRLRGWAANKAGIVFVTDASLTAWAAVRINGEDPALSLDIRGNLFHASDLREIYYKELHATAEAITSVSEHDIATTVVVDNRAVFHTLQRGYTLNEKAAPDVRRITQHLAAFNIALFVRWIPTEKNCADPYTRWTEDEMQAIRSGEPPDDSSRYEAALERAPECHRLARGLGFSLLGPDKKPIDKKQEFPLSNVAPDEVY
jgi:hypothetical protein